MFKNNNRHIIHEIFNKIRVILFFHHALNVLLQFTPLRCEIQKTKSGEILLYVTQ